MSLLRGLAGLFCLFYLGRGDSTDFAAPTYGLFPAGRVYLYDKHGNPGVPRLGVE